MLFTAPDLSPVDTRVLQEIDAKDTGLKDGTASGDLRALVATGLLVARGETKGGRTYTAAHRLLDLRCDVRSEMPSVVDPYAVQRRTT